MTFYFSLVLSFRMAKLKQELESKEKEAQDRASQYEEQIQQLQQELENERSTR